MPAMLDDPSSSTIYRTSGMEPYPNPHDPQPSLPEDVYPRQVTLRDRVTTATIIPFSSPHQVPPSLLAYLSDQLNKEISNGDTYPMLDPMPASHFATYWFQNFGAIMILGSIDSTSLLSLSEKDWSRECLGSFYIKPNYPGRSSHICNAGFLVTDASRNRGVGRLMGESYLDWAPKLGYTYSVFNLVYETNVASCRIWDALGFKRIGRVKGAGNLKSYPNQLIDAIIFGRDLGPDGEDFVSEERFDKIKFYLKFGKYPAGADRAEKSRLRSAATHYKLIPETDKLMLKDKEVISDPQKQYEIARNIHILQHGGINKTTATIAEKYHWVRIKETVSQVIRNCSQCKELGKAPVVRGNDGGIRPAPRSIPSSNLQNSLSSSSSNPLSPNQQNQYPSSPGQGSVSPQVLNRTLPQSSMTGQSISHGQHDHHNEIDHSFMPLDPQIMEDIKTHLSSYNSHSHSSAQNIHSHHHSPTHEPSSATSTPSPSSELEADSFQAMLSSSSHHHQNRNLNLMGSNTLSEGNLNSMSPNLEGEDLDMLLNHDGEGNEDGEGESDVDVDVDVGVDVDVDVDVDVEGDGDGAIIQLQAEAAARAAEEAMRTVGREYGDGERGWEGKREIGL